VCLDRQGRHASRVRVKVLSLASAAPVVVWS